MLTDSHKYNEHDLPLITVITVVYNAEAYIERAIKSVIDQNYSNMEYIIIDGKSSDNTPSIIKKFEDNITRWVSERDSGIYDAMNKGVGLSTGEYLVFLNADDYFDNENVISNAVALLDEASEGVCGAIKFMDTNNNVLYTLGAQKDNRYGYVMHQAFLYKRSLHFRVGLYDITYKVNADYNFYQQALSLGIKFKYTPMVFANMYVDGFSGRNKILSAVETLLIQLNNQIRPSKGISQFLVKLIKIVCSEILSQLNMKWVITVHRKMFK